MVVLLNLADSSRTYEANNKLHMFETYPETLLAKSN